MSSRDLLIVLFYLSPIILLAGIILNVRRFKLISGWAKLLFIYLVTALITDLTGRVLAHYSGSNLLLVPLYGFVELLIIGILYKKYMLKAGAWLTYVLVIMLLLILADGYQVASVGRADFQSYGRVIDYACIMALCLYYFFQTMAAGTFNKDKLILNSAILIYAIIDLLIFLPINFLINLRSDEDLRLIIWFIHFMLTISFYVLLIYMIWKNGRSRLQSSSG